MTIQDVERSSRASFVALCVYLVAQAYTIPVAAIGPWPVWPTLPTLAAIPLLFFAQRDRGPRARESSQLLVLLVAIWVGCALSFQAAVVFNGAFLLRDSVFVRVAVFQLLRLAEFVLVLWAVSRIPITANRLSVIGRIAAVVLVWLCVGVYLTYLGVVSPSVFAPQIPVDLSVSGPWARYHTYPAAGIRIGWGTVGYNHALVSFQILLLLALRLHATGGISGPLDFILTLMAITAAFFSQSRTGLAVVLLFAAAMVLPRPVYTLVGVALVTLLFLAVTQGRLDSGPKEGEVVERQLTLLQPHTNLSGRDRLWRGKLRGLAERPWVLAVGAGFGSTRAIGDDLGEDAMAHMLGLQLLIEVGLLGLAAFTFVMYRILRWLGRLERGGKPILWATIALLVSSLTLETFYPLPWLGTFTGLYLAVVAIVLQRFPVADSDGRVRDGKAAVV